MGDYSNIGKYFTFLFWASIILFFALILSVGTIIYFLVK